MTTEIEPIRFPFPPVYVVTTKREYRARVRELGGVPGKLKGLAGVASCLDNGVVIWVEARPEKLNGYGVYSMAAHESVHAAVHLLKSIGEDKPGEEMLAYMVQTMTEGIMRTVKEAQGAR